jgi:hypothetical protein
MMRMTKPEFLGNTGCQPVVFGNLPRNFSSCASVKRMVATPSVAGKLPATASWQPALPKTKGPLSRNF